MICNDGTLDSVMVWRCLARAPKPNKPKARFGPVDPTLAGTMPTFEKPRKAILSKDHLAQFQASQCHKDIVSYIESLNASVTGVKLSDECPQSPVS